MTPAAAPSYLRQLNPASCSLTAAMPCTLASKRHSIQAAADSPCAVQSGIHGWGLFARRFIRADTMVLEYRGERVRRTVADARERRYRLAGKDCYLFNVDDETVIDATQRGTIGRFTVCFVAACMLWSMHILHAPTHCPYVCARTTSGAHIHAEAAAAAAALAAPALPDVRCMVTRAAA